MDFDKVFAFARSFDGAIEQHFLVDITWIESDEVSGQLRTKVVDLRQDIWHIHHVTHWKGWIDLAHIWSCDQTQASFNRVLMSPATENVKIICASNRLRHDFSGENFFLAPDHAIFQRRIDDMFLMQSVMHSLDIINEANEAIRFQLLQLIKIECAEEPMSPSECGVRIDNDIGMFILWMCRRDDILECSSA